MQLRFSARSRRDLGEIGDYVARDSPRQADLLVGRLEQFCLTLIENPNRFPVVRERGRARVRRAVSGSYSIFYVLAADRVEIVRILHSARNFEKLFPDED